MMATRQQEATHRSAGGRAQCHVLLQHDYSVAHAGIHPRGTDFSQRQRRLCSSCDQDPAHPIPSAAELMARPVCEAGRSAAWTSGFSV